MTFDVVDAILPSPETIPHCYRTTSLLLNVSMMDCCGGVSLGVDTATDIRHRRHSQLQHLMRLYSIQITTRATSLLACTYRALHHGELKALELRHDCGILYRDKEWCR
jgi:hypothetical protein